MSKSQSEIIGDDPEIKKITKRIPIAEASYRPVQDDYHVVWFIRKIKKFSSTFPLSLIQSEEESITADSMEYFDLEFEVYSGSEASGDGRLISTITKYHCRSCLQEPFYDQKKEEFFCPNCQ